ncbi:MAG: DUF5050 domain-containing protein [Methanosarcinaceae archaeon]|nr:DUF5050 domain-containing protein [Methanosarcinaceae archaeon]
MNKIIVLFAVFCIIMVIVPATAGESIKRLIDDPIPDSKPDWNPENNLIAFQSDRGESADIWVMKPDGSDLKQLTTNLTLDLYASWSPDGTMITFYSDRTGGSEIWVMNADGTNQKKITNNSYWDGNPAWGPDNRIAFSSTQSGYMKIWVMNADGTNQMQLTTGNSSDDAVSWSPDGQYITFISSRSNDGDIWKMNVGTKEYTLLVSDTHYELAPPDNACPNLMSTAWSPDGNKIAFHSYASSSGAIWIMDADGSNKTMVYDRKGADYYSPTWSPDGNMIAFQEKILDSETGESNIVILDLNTTRMIPQNTGLFSLICLILVGIILHRRD